MAGKDPQCVVSPDLEAARALTTKVLAIGTWAAKDLWGTAPPIMLSEATDATRLFLAGKIDHWFWKTDGSGPVFLMAVDDLREARVLLSQLPLSISQMVLFDLISLNQYWPVGLLIGRDASKAASA